MTLKVLQFFGGSNSLRVFSHPTEEKIYNFSLLKKGWNYGEGEKISNAALKDALLIHRQIIYRGHSQTDAFPGLDGEIQLTVYEGKNYFSFERESTGKWSISHEVDHNEVELLSGLNLEKVTDYLSSISSKLCTLSDYYQGNTIGTRYVIASTTWRSSRDLTEFPSLTEIVA
jgi:hypothetical protein